MKVFTTLLTAALFVLVLSSCSKSKGSSDSGTSADPNATNIIFIIADDLGWDVFGDYPGINGIKANTPTLDSLALKGITFTNFWSNPVCAPTRAAMLTGKYGFRTGVGGVPIPVTTADVLKSNEIVIQKYINDKTTNKYATAVIGKWHVSLNSQLIAPENFGVGYYSGIFSGTVPDYYNWTQTSNGSQQNITTYTSTHLVNQSVSWIQQQNKPFFLWLALNAPHAPFHRPPLNLITNQTLSASQVTINANPLPYYLASIEAMDKEIGRLISSLTAAQKQNTVFVFMGDNGTPAQVAQAPYTVNGTKSTLFQGGINTPLLICGKGVTRTNVLDDALVQSPDMFASFADITGTGTTNYQDGISIKPLFTDANAPKRTFAYSEQFGQSAPATDGYAVRNSNYKLIHVENGAEYFYNLSIDPFEQTNLLLSTLSAEAQQNLTQLRQIKAGL
jgi:arylsulfatase B